MNWVAAQFGFSRKGRKEDDEGANNPTMSEFASPAGPSPAPRRRRVARKTMMHQQQEPQSSLSSPSTAPAGFDDGLSVNDLPTINLPTDPFSKSSTTPTTTRRKKRSPETDVVGLAENLAAHTADGKPGKKPPAKKKAKKGGASATAATKASSGQAKAELCSEGVPAETLPDGFSWSEGWVRKVYMRKGGKTAGTKDAYWFTPVIKFKLRSIPEVVRFMKALRACNGDETEARKKWKEPQFAPPAKPATPKKTTKASSTTKKTSTSTKAPKKDDNTKNDGGEDDGGDGHADADTKKPPPHTQV